MKILNEVHNGPSCPVCGEDLRDKDIYTHFLERYGDVQKAKETAAFYGATPENPKSFSRMIGIETSQYDGVTWWMCPDCKARWKRFEWSDEKYLKEMGEIDG